MVFLNSENQMLAIEKVLEEMQKAEETINSWNAMWWEEYVDCVLPQEYFDRFHWDKLLPCSLNQILPTSK